LVHQRHLLLTIVMTVCLCICSSAIGLAESVSFWTQYTTNATLLSVLNDFTRETGIEVELRNINWDTDAIFIGIASGSLPDLFTHGAASLGAFAAQGFMAPLEPYMANWLFLKDMIPQIREAGVYNGQQIAITWNGISVRDIAYRADFFAEAGLSASQFAKNWDDFIPMAKKLVQRDASGKLLRSAIVVPKSGTTIQQWWSMLHHQAGGDLLVNGLPHLNDGTAVEALQYYADMIHMHRLDDLNFSGNLTKGTSAMSWTSWGNIKPLIDSGMDIGIAQFPYKVRPATFLATDWAAIPLGAKNPEGAAKLLEYLLHPERQKLLNQGVGGAVPFYRNAMQWDWVKSAPQLQHLFAAAAYGVPNPPHVLWFEIREILLTNITEAVKGTTPPKTAIEQAQDSLMQLFKEHALTR
jgi:ABC-type glycerol-3-phosphate transport system substrate-binding protein